MKKLINRVEDVLNEQLQGLAKAHPQLTLHQDPLYVTRTDAPVAGKVALLSGGGSGHEPMHCGYIGQGMLSGACPGEIFTSPTPDKMFECAMQIDGVTRWPGKSWAACACPIPGCWPEACRPPTSVRR